MINNSLKKKWEWQNWTYWLVTVSKSIGSTDNRLNFCRIKIDTCKWNNHIYVQWNLSEPNTCTLKALKQRLQTIIHSPSTHQQLFQESEQNKHWKIMNSLKHFTHTKWTECAKSQGSLYFKLIFPLILLTYVSIISWCWLGQCFTELVPRSTSTTLHYTLSSQWSVLKATKYDRKLNYKK